MFMKASKTARPRITQGYSAPSPRNGLNTRDQLSMMADSYAINLTNWIATPQGLSVRQGYKQHATGLGGWVNSLFAYKAQAGGADKLFAAAGTSFYDVTNPGAVGAAVVTGLSNSEWQYTNFAASNGQYLIACNGVDATRHYDGTSWVTWTEVGTPTTPGQISGINPDLFSNIVTHQRRIWFVEANSSRAWYLPVNSVGGVATEFDFGPLFPRGGNLVSLVSWTVNGGYGLSNNLIAVSDSGDVAIYQGTDPSDSNKWSIIATWMLGAPIGKRCMLNYGGDVLFLSQDGCMPLSQYMQTVNNQPALTDAIKPTISSLVDTQAGISGWQMHNSLHNNLLILNVPQVDPSQNIQFIFNTITNGWSLFNGWPAQCWNTLNASTYFGGNGVVCLAFDGYTDNADTNGLNGNTYIATAQQAYDYFQQRAMRKRYTLARISLVTAGGSVALSMGCTTDFNLNTPNTIAVGNPSASGVSIWGTDVWNTAKWSGGYQNINSWESISGIGYCASITVSVAVLSETIWVSTDWQYEPGGVMG